MLMFTSTHLLVASDLLSRVEIVGNRPFVTLTEGKSNQHRVTLSLIDVDAIDGLIAALTRGRRSLAPPRAGEAA